MQGQRFLSEIIHNLIPTYKKKIPQLKL